jgi:predicted dehydrogenase
MPYASRELSVLVVGCGSIGRRHFKNLRAFGVANLAACDPNEVQLSTVTSETGAQGFLDLESALGAFQPQVVFVCSPPVFHVFQALQALCSGANVFIEKPLSHTLEGVEALRAEAVQRGRVVQVGYNLRFHPLVRKVKELLAQGAIGTPQWARVEVGQSLPDWRPSQDYRWSYTARQELGGGIILDGSHELDYVLWLLGRPVEVCCMAGRVSNLEVDVEDCATVLLRFPGGAQADVHMDMVQPVRSRSGKLTGDEGVVEWDLIAQELRWRRTASESWQVEGLATDFQATFDGTYVEEVRSFFNRVEEGDTSLESLQSARLTLEVAVAAKAAAESGTAVRLP